ncbi:MAG: carbohydrate kinase family protein [Minisyncoccia bacterium]
MFEVITIGSATRDAFFEGMKSVIFHDPRLITKKGIGFPLGAKVKVERVHFMTGGGVTNTAFTFKRMGLNVSSIFRIGKDVSGETILRELENEGIDVSLVQFDYVQPTAYSVILMAENGERTILSFKGASKNFDFSEIPFKKLETNWLFLGSLGEKRQNLKFFLKFKKDKSLKLAINPGREELIYLKDNYQDLSYFDIFIVNQEEASYLTGIDYLNEKKLFQKIDQLVKGIVVMTKGKKGVSVSDGKYLYSAKAVNYLNYINRKNFIKRSLKKKETTGAGDAFASAFVGSLIKSGKIDDSEIEKAIRLALINSSSVVNYLGAKTGILYLKEIDFSKIENIKIKKIKLN